MLLAKDARELTEKAIENEIQEREKEAREFCETISSKIEQVASTKCNFTTIGDVPNKIRSYVIKMLKDNGYTVKQIGVSSLNILW